MACLTLPVALLCNCSSTSRRTVESKLFPRLQETLVLNSFVRALPVILETLAPLREKGYLTTFSNGTLIKSAVTVIGTGNSPLDDVLALSPRDYFFDAPLAELSTTETLWNVTISPVASTDYEVAVGWNGIGNISEAQLTNLTQFVNDAHERGIAARYWDTPGWPIQARNNVWKQLADAGADWLNADDLEAASQF